MILELTNQLNVVSHLPRSKANSVANNSSPVGARAPVTLLKKTTAFAACRHLFFLGPAFAFSLGAHLEVGESTAQDAASLPDEDCCSANRRRKRASAAQKREIRQKMIRLESTSNNQPPGA
ncbi:hypothetical protein CEXT_221521 [Caerostris extrusa]|uniref:Uncharacterized protein n=1 Tax=Caerostris extrusa TaxID=172846 RepID=A0AAV4RI33_CAEEX|nr:hypothetical protein CEXT_221521 [Caerostris extrusa]